MPNFMNVTLMGHVGNPPTLRYTSAGVAVASFRMAVNNTRRKEDPPTWVTVTVWRQTAEFVNQYVTQGAAVLVNGSWLALSEWTGQDGKARTSLELTADRIELVGARTDGTHEAAPDGEELPF